MSTADQYYRDGAAALKAGDTTAAVKALRAAVEADPNAGPAWLLLGVAAASGGHALLAQEALNRAGELLPTDARVPYNRGRIAQAAGDIDAARTFYEQAQTLDPESTRIQEALLALPQPKPGASPVDWHVIRRIEPVPVMKLTALLTLLSWPLLAVALWAEISGNVPDASPEERPLRLGITVALFLLLPLLYALSNGISASLYNWYADRWTGLKLRWASSRDHLDFSFVDIGSAIKTYLVVSAPGILLLLAVAVPAFVVVAVVSGQNSPLFGASAVIIDMVGLVAAFVSWLVNSVLGALAIGLLYNLAIKWFGPLRAAGSAHHYSLRVEGFHFLGALRMDLVFVGGFLLLMLLYLPAAMASEEGFSFAWGLGALAVMSLLGVLVSAVSIVAYNYLVRLIGGLHMTVDRA